MYFIYHFLAFLKELGQKKRYFDYKNERNAKTPQLDEKGTKVVPNGQERVRKPA
jgi:hypothetical protein